jgi:pyruvate/2-oxoglutarate dehydrogenase complex dihydrolipoamide acyltransferase (E2) component
MADMALFSKHLNLGPALKISSWRKVAIGTWKTVGDPSVYGTIDVDVGPALAYLEKLNQNSETKITFTHFVGKAVALAIAKHPEINCILRFGRLYPRKTVDIFFQVATDSLGRDLSGTTIREADKKSVFQIAQEMQESIDKIRNKGDPDFRRMKGTLGLIPGALVAVAINLTSLFLYTLNIWSALFGSPKDPFGSIMITSIGSIGMDMAFAPLVPYSRVPALLAVGMIRDVPVVCEGKIEIGKRALLCATIDHRVIDGIHASQMIKTLRKTFADPEKELGVPFAEGISQIKNAIVCDN